MCHNMIQEIRNMGETNKTRYVIDEYHIEDEGLAIGLAQGEARGKANSILLVLKTNHGRVPKPT